MNWRAILCLSMASGAFGQEAPRAEPADVPPDVPVEVAPAIKAGETRATSRSGQFQVAGADGALRGSVALLAEEAKSELLALTGEKDEWKTPITVLLRGSPGDPVPPRTLAMSLFFSEAGYELRIDAHLARGVERERFLNLVTGALLYERALRGREPGETEVELYVPPWLVEGLREAVDWQRQRGDRRPYAALFESGGVFRLDDLFAVEEAGHERMDAATRLAFRVSAGSLVMALLEQPDGKDGFRGFLAAVAAHRGEMPALLREHFPGMNLSDTSLTKWWTLQMASKAAATLTDALSIRETEAALEDALRLHFRTADGSAEVLPVARWKEMPEMSSDALAAAVRPAEDALIRLSYRCFPSYRPLVAEYQVVLGHLSRKEFPKAESTLADLAKTRATMIAKAERARDFLDWFEITRARETSGAFDDYLRLKDRLREERHYRDDPVSGYLDRMDEIFSRGGELGPPAASR